MRTESFRRNPANPCCTAAGRTPAVLALASMLLVFQAAAPRSAEAAGLTLQRFGGIYGTPNSDGGLATFYNPALLSLNPGFIFSVDGTLIHRSATYNRVIAPFGAEDAEDPENPTEGELARYDARVRTNTGLATTSTTAVLPYASLGYVHEFDTINAGFAYAPVAAFGGGGEWDRNEGAPSEFPGAIYGPQRWNSLSGGLTVIQHTLSVGVALKEFGLMFGGSLILATAELSVVRSRNLNAGDAPIDLQGNLQEGMVHFGAKDVQPTFTLAVACDRERTRASIVYRHGYDLDFVGPLSSAFATVAPVREDAYTQFPLPRMLQGALTGIFNNTSLTLTVDWTEWSVIEENDIRDEKDRDVILLKIPRNFNNTVSARLRLDQQLTDRWMLSFMAGFDPSAIPNTSVDPSLSDANKAQIGVGIQAILSDNLTLLASYTHDIYPKVTVTESVHEPRSNGAYTDTRLFLNVSLAGRF